MPGLCCACLCYCMVSYFLIVNKSGLETALGIQGRSTLLLGTLWTAHPGVQNLHPIVTFVP